MKRQSILIHDFTQTRKSRFRPQVCRLTENCNVDPIGLHHPFFVGGKVVDLTVELSMLIFPHDF